MWPHRRQPTRLPRPWDSPGRNTGVGCHFLLQCSKVKSESEVAQLCLTLSDPMDCSLPGSSVHGIFQARVLEWGAIAFSGLQCMGSQRVRQEWHDLACTHSSLVFCSCILIIHITCLTSMAPFSSRHHSLTSFDINQNWLPPLMDAWLCL